MNEEGINQTLQETLLEKSAKKKGKIFFVVGMSIIILTLFYLSITKYDLKGSLTGKTIDGRIQEEAIISVSIDDDPVLGNKDAPITIVEFSDFECPFCGKHFLTSHPQIVENYVNTGKVKIVYRDFPLDFHKNAQKAAEAAECADEQGKFWEMHDKLFLNQDSLSMENFKQWAKDIELDAAQFNACIDSEKYVEEIQNDVKDGTKYGISGTPTFFINNQILKGAQPYEVFEKTIETALAKTS